MRTASRALGVLLAWMLLVPGSALASTARDTTPEGVHDRGPLQAEEEGPRRAQPPERRQEGPEREGRQQQHEHEHEHEQEQEQEQEQEPPPLPEGMTLEEVLEYAAGQPPGHFPDPVPDDAVYAFTLFEQLEYRFADEPTPDQLGWEAQGWIGGDFNKFWWKSEGEAVFEGAEEGETETDLLYSRLISPFWSLQGGVQYANEWTPAGEYEDRWSAVIAFQGLAPYEFELDSSLYLSTGGDLTLELEVEYGIRITQRLLLQPRTELAFSAQDIPERALGSGLTDANLDLRLHYEMRRDLAPYLGVRWRYLVGETGDRAEASGADAQQRFVVFGIRFAL